MAMPAFTSAPLSINPTLSAPGGGGGGGGVGGPGSINSNSMGAASKYQYPNASGDAAGNDAAARSIFQESSHPVALAFLLAFRAMPLVLYYLLGFLKDDVMQFVLVVLALSLDFWTVKNVSGRLLVGLRWWSQVLPDGTSKWVFESRANNKPNAIDRKFFWLTLYTAPLLWGLQTFISIFSISKPIWLVLCIVALLMSSANLAGYIRCDKDAKKRLSSYGEAMLFSSVGQSMVSRMVSGMFSSGGSKNGGGAASGISEVTSVL